jgi:hypothetical protein
MFSLLLAFYWAGAPAALSQPPPARADELYVVKTAQVKVEVKKEDFAKLQDKALSARTRPATAGRQSSAGGRRPAVKRTAAVDKRKLPASAGAKDAALTTEKARLDVEGEKAAPSKPNRQAEQQEFEAGEEGGGAGRKLTKEEVKSLAKELGLLDTPKVNPDLAFNDDDASNLLKRRADDAELKRELAARKAVLDAADKQEVVIRDRNTLSHVVAQFLLVVAPQKKSEPPPTPAPTPKDDERRGVTDIPILICVGDTGNTGATSAELIAKAWAALNDFKAARRDEAGKYADKVQACTKVVIDTWTRQADEQEAARLQAGECKTNPGVKGKDAYFESYWALSDISAAWFIRGQFNSHQRNWVEARRAYTSITSNYPCAYIWDPRGWFWRAAEGAENELRRIDAGL